MEKEKRKRMQNAKTDSSGELTSFLFCFDGEHAKCVLNVCHIPKQMKATLPQRKERLSTTAAHLRIHLTEQLKRKTKQSERKTKECKMSRQTAVVSWQGMVKWCERTRTLFEHKLNTFLQTQRHRAAVTVRQMKATKITKKKSTVMAMVSQVEHGETLNVL